MRENNMCYRIWFIFVIYLQVEEGKIIMFGGGSLCFIWNGGGPFMVYLFVSLVHVNNSLQFTKVIW